jgi:hypothetical protein
MGHFANIDENNTVVNVIVVDNKDLIKEGYTEEEAGKEFIASIGLEGNWIQTSYNNKTRNKFAGISDKYDPVNDVFVDHETADSKGFISWGGVVKPTTPSILVDSPMRCSNMYTLNLLTKSFPDAFIRWGYLNPHNQKTFAMGQGEFNVMLAIARNPLDSIASNIVISNYQSASDINSAIDSCHAMLKSVQMNKQHITIVKFEDVTSNPQLFVDKIATILNISPVSFDINTVKKELEETAIDDFYSVPIDNADKLANAKNILQANYADKIANCASIYQELIA